MINKPYDRKRYWFVETLEVFGKSKRDIKKRLRFALGGMDRKVIVHRKLDKRRYLVHIAVTTKEDFARLASQIYKMNNEWGNSKDKICQ